MDALYHERRIRVADLGLQIVGALRQESPVVVQFVRDLLPADMPLLKLEKASKPAPLKRLHDSHHTLARLVAEGVAHMEISLITGYAISRISILLGDPSFAELVEFYRGAKREAVADVELRMKHLLVDTIQEMHERLQDDPESVSYDELQKNAKLLADRTGFGPTSKVQQTIAHVGFAERLAATRDRMKLVSSAPSELTLSAGEVGGASPSAPDDGGAQ